MENGNGKVEKVSSAGGSPLNYSRKSSKNVKLVDLPKYSGREDIRRLTKKSEFNRLVGTMRAPKTNNRANVSDLDRIVVKSEVDLHIVRLLTLHPTLKVRFRDHDLASLDSATKKHC